MLLLGAAPPQPQVDRGVVPLGAGSGGTGTVAAAATDGVAAWAAGRGAGPAEPEAPAATPPPAAGSPPGSERSGPPTPSVPVGSAAPARVLLPELGVDAPVAGVRTAPDGELGVPDDVDVVGWWSGGSRPGRPGSTVLAGHVDSREQGPGAFFRLRELKPGSPVVVTDAAGRQHRYAVEALRQVDKAELPPEVFAQDVAERLVLITCGGRFDEARRHYADNVLVFAVPAP